MIRIDDALSRWAGAPENAWSPALASDAADRMATRLGLTVLWEPGDEEWILLADAVAYQGMISIRYPMALLTTHVASEARSIDSALDIVEITEFLDENLSADAELLKATALPHGWDDDFNPQAFCANDLFVESV